MTPIHSWWDWCTESFGHMFAGVTAPILFALAFLVVIVAGCGDDASEPQPPRSDVAGVCVTGTPGSDAASSCGTPIDGLLVSTATPVPPTPTPAPRSYTVKAGDSLYLICSNEAPDMDADACIAAIVDLSDLAGPDEIAEGQVLRLPPRAGATPASGTPSTTSSAGSRRTPAPTVRIEPTPVEEPVFEPEATAEPEPTPEPTSEPPPYASIVAIGQPSAEPEDEEPTPEPDGAGAEPTPTDEELADSEGSEYTVQDGDSLLGICVAEVPEMNEDECIDFVVLLNDLSGPDEIRSGQVLVLP